MTLQEMVSIIHGSYGNRFQTDKPGVLRAIDAAQKAAFNHDCRAFERTAPLGESGEFPEDAREIIEITGLGNYEIDAFARRVVFSGDPQGAKIRYYMRPETLRHGWDEETGDIAFAPEEEALAIVPDEWRWQTLAQPAIALLDSGLYGDKSPQALLETYFREWWAAMDARPLDRKPLESMGAW